MSEDLKEFLIKLMAAVAAVTWLIILHRAHQDERYPNFTWLGFVTTPQGYPDRAAWMELGSWIALTIVLAWITVQDRLTEWFALIYAGLPALRAGQGAWMRSNAPPGTTTSTVSSTTSRTTEAKPDVARPPIQP